MLNNKHIPNLYKYNSRENRLKLLAGLIDSDGWYDTIGSCFEFTQKNETLMDDVIYLCRSLGFACYKSSKKTSWKYKGVKNEGTAFRITISGSGLDEIPTVIPRKRANPRRQTIWGGQPLKETTP
jgi:intein/homing endonuclease